MIERPATRDDVDALVDLFCRYETRYRGFPDSDASDLLDDWNAPGWDFARQSLVLEDDGAIVGYATVVDEFSDTVVDPDRYDRALSERLLAWCEEHPGLLEHYVPDGDAGLNALLGERGWVPERRFWRMRRELDGEVPTPVWPDGVRVREYVRPDDDEAVHALITTSFREIGGQTERTLEAWRGFLLDTDRFDPTLYLLVEDEAGTLLAACLGQDMGEYGMVRQLAVSPAARGKGLGLALLHESMHRAAARGKPALVLGVDAGNPTGALDLYEKAGMRVHEQFTRWDRPQGA